MDQSVLQEGPETRILLLVGEPGIGKTYFLQQWIKQFKARIFSQFCNRRKRGTRDSVQDSEQAFYADTYTDPVKQGRPIQCYEEVAVGNDFTQHDLSCEFLNRPVIIEHFARENTSSSDVWTTLDRLTAKVRELRSKSTVNCNLSSATTLSALTLGLPDSERARQLRQLGAQFFASMGPTVSNCACGNLESIRPPILIVIDSVDALEDPIARTPEAIKCSDWLFSCFAPDGHMDSSEMYETLRGGLPIVPPGVRIILTCSPTSAICQRLSRSSYVRVVNYPVDEKFTTRKTHSSRTAPFAGDLLNLNHQDEHRIAQPPELVRLLPDLSDLPVISELQQTTVPFQHFLEADQEGLQKATALVRARITDPVALRAYEQWPLRHLPLAQKMLAHELHSSSFGFDTINNEKEFQAWNNYREQLVATQSLRQLILRLLQQWSIEMEADLISMEYVEHNLGQSQSLHGRNWTVSWVGLVLHCCLTASYFTWTAEEVKHKHETNDLRHGFRVDGLLKVVQSLRFSELELRRCSTKEAQFGIECELLPYLLLRLLHRAGAFTQNTGGAVLCQTDTDGYIGFGHEIVESVLYQVLARDSEATGVHLPLESCVIKLIGEFQNYNPTAFRKLGGKRTPSTSRPSPVVDDGTIIPGRARVTFRQVGSIFHALVSVSSPRFNPNGALSTNSRNNRLSTHAENSLIQCLLDRPDGDAYKHSTATNSSQYSLRSETHSNPLTVREMMLSWISDPNKRAHTRHALLLTETANLVNYRLGTTHNSTFAFKMVSYQISKLAMFPDPLHLERAVLQLDSLVTDPSILTCMANPEFRRQPFIGTVYNAHLLVVYWRFAKTLIHALSPQRSSSPSPAWTRSVNSSNRTHSDTFYSGSSASDKAPTFLSNQEVNGDLNLLGRCTLETLRTVRGECIKNTKQPHMVRPVRALDE
ncbi:hypothetical protein PHET_01721 [Paragonimus heterotremus]|uniref:Uncharacterized protein n=1 Tax=Paragonimus heterotremus TaxID=100268 RepID=A0A8J4TR98_9TREM|nr:hypothetical protein PHET_01721 [Paragonimus heterotremus]